jgi:hypothetical protein
MQFWVQIAVALLTNGHEKKGFLSLDPFFGSWETPIGIMAMMNLDRLLFEASFTDAVRSL